MLASSPTSTASEHVADPWDGLRAEFDQWRTAGRTATIWWRDDDAVEPSPALDRLLSLADRYNVPVALAVIPKTATQALADRVAPVPGVEILQHGWAHANHAHHGEKKMELGDHRPVEIVARELEYGFDRLSDLFDAQFRPVLVPPWNRMGAAVRPSLSGLGFQGASLFGARAHRRIDNLVLSNTHADPIAWHGGRGFAGDNDTIAAITNHLADRRTGRVDADEPTGLLTHHLVHDAETWDFIRRCLDVIDSHEAARLVTASEAFLDGPS